MDEYAEALAGFNRVLALNPAQVWALAGRAVVYRATGRYADALADFNRAIELDSEIGRASCRERVY